MATTTGRPARTRSAAKATPAKVAQAPATPTAAATEVPATKATVPANIVDFAFVEETTNFTKWRAPDGLGFTGVLYAPKGVTELRVRLTKP